MSVSYERLNFTKHYIDNIQLDFNLTYYVSFFKDKNALILYCDMCLTSSYMIKYVKMYDNYVFMPFLINIITCILIYSKLTCMLQVHMDKLHVNIN